MFRRSARTIIRCQATGIISAVLLTACAQLPPVPADSPPHETCGDVMEFYAAISRLSDTSRRDMLQTLRADLSQSSEACDHLRLALLLSRPGTTYQDDETAADLLDVFLHDPAQAQHPARGLALLLIDDINERHRLRLLGHGLQLRLKQERTATKILRRQSKALRSQLDQLKSIERDINEKERAVTSPPANEKTP